MRIVIAAGGTAGHVYPGLALARVLRQGRHDVSFAGTGRGVEAGLVPAAGFEFREVRALPLVRRVSPAALRAPLAALRAVRRAGDLVRGADVVVGMGGYVSVPVVLAARRQRIPIVLHEQNAVPGLANRALARLARAVAVSFTDAVRSFPRRTRVVLTGNPVREEVVRVREERDTLAKEAVEELGLDPGRRTILVFGGSQGALHIDRAAVGACYLLRGRADLQVVLIAGPAHLERVERAMPARPDGLAVRLFGYLDRIDLAYARSDLVVSRAGATTVAEVTASGLPALFVPYPYATDRHQEANARAVERAGGGAVMLDGELSPEALSVRIAGMIDHPAALRRMAERSSACGRPDAAERLAELTIEAGR